MSAHTHTILTEGCYRCDLHRDEVRAYVASLLVTRRGVVHDRTCRFVSGPCSSAVRWVSHPGDRACAVCLPLGLPGVA